MQIQYPHNLDKFGPDILNKKQYNATAPTSGAFTIEDAMYIIHELEHQVGDLSGTGNEANHERRLLSVEQELDAITQQAVTDAGFGLQKNGNEIALANPILGAVAAIGTVTSQQGHGQFTDFPSFIAGMQNLRNGITRYNCIDTVNYIEIESPDSIAGNRKQYLKDLSGKIPVEESDGTLGVLWGYKVAGDQVVGRRLAAITITTSEPAGTAREGGFGFDSKTEFDAFVAYVSTLRNDIESLLVALTTHGLVSSD